MDQIVINEAKELRKTHSYLTEYESIRLIMEDRKMYLLNLISDRLKEANTNSEFISKSLGAPDDTVMSSLNSILNAIDKD